MFRDEGGGAEVSKGLAELNILRSSIYTPALCNDLC